MIKFVVAFMLFMFAFGCVSAIALMVTWLPHVWALVLSTLFIVLVILCIGFMAEEA